MSLNPISLSSSKSTNKRPREEMGTSSSSCDPNPLQPNKKAAIQSKFDSLQTLLTSRPQNLKFHFQQMSNKDLMCLYVKTIGNTAEQCLNFGNKVLNRSAPEDVDTSIELYKHGITLTQSGVRNNLIAVKLYSNLASAFIRKERNGTIDRDTLIRTYEQGAALEQTSWEGKYIRATLYLHLGLALNERNLPGDQDESIRNFAQGATIAHLSDKGNLVRAKTCLYHGHALRIRNRPGDLETRIGSYGRGAQLNQISLEGKNKKAELYLSLGLALERRNGPGDLNAALENYRLGRTLGSAEAIRIRLLNEQTRLARQILRVGHIYSAPAA